MICRRIAKILATLQAYLHLFMKGEKCSLYRWLVFLIIILNHAAIAQSNKADSLRQVLAVHKEDDTTRVRLLNDISVVTIPIDSIQARKYAQEAIRLSDKLNYPIGKARSFFVIGRSLGYNNSDSLALKYYQRAIKLADESGDQLGLAQYLLAYGFTFSAVGDIQEAIRCYERSLKIAELLHYSKCIIRCRVNLSIIYTGQGDYEKALAEYQRILHFLDEKKSQDKSDRQARSAVYNNIGEINKYQGNYTSALEFYQKSLKIREELKDERGRSLVLSNIGCICTLQGDYEEALSYQDKALKIAESNNDKRRIASCYEEKGNIYMQQGKKEAIEYLQKSLEIVEGLSYLTPMLTVLIKIGDFYFLQKKYDKALENYLRALSISEKMKRKRTISEISLKIGHLYFHEKDYQNAFLFSQKGLELANELNLLSSKKDAHKQLAEIYAVTSQYQKAYQHQVEYKILDDSIFSERNVKKLAELEYAYKFEKEKQVLELEQKRKDEVQRATVVSLIAGLVLLFLFSGYVYRVSRIKHRINIVLTRQKGEIEELNKELVASNDALTAAKELVEKSEERLRLLIKNSNDILILLNETGEQSFVSNAAQALTGYTVEELHAPAEHVVVDEDRELISQHWQRVLARKDVPDVIQYRHRHKTNGYVWFESVAQNFLDHPAINAVVCNVRDITERKKAEFALQESEAAKAKLLKYEIERINSELEVNQKSMTAATLKLLQNAERDAQVIDRLTEIEQGCSPDAKQKIKALICEHKRFSSNSNWSEFEILFEKVHHSFYERLHTQFPTLTPNERRICAFLKLNMSNKDIAQITFQSEDALKKARLRLRQKLEIDREMNLGGFLQNI